MLNRVGTAAVAARRFLVVNATLALTLSPFDGAAVEPARSHEARAPAPWIKLDVDSKVVGARAPALPSGEAALAQLDQGLLRSLLATAPQEGAFPVRESSTIIRLPRPDGVFERFAFVESSVMQPQLQAEFPEIRSYLGQGLDDPAATVRFDVSLLGFRAQVLGPAYLGASAQSAWYISALEGGEDATRYLSYWRGAAAAVAGASVGADCSTPQPAELPHFDGVLAQQGGFEVVRNEFSIAVAATGEFSTNIAAQMNPPQTPSVALTMSVINNTVNRLNQILERDGPVRLNLVNNNSQIVYLDPNTDPYVGIQTDFDGDGQPDWLQMMAENQSNLDSVIGTDNYGLGHVFHWQANGYSGLASVAGVCDEDNKARAISAVSTAIDPTTNFANDIFVVDLVAHEVGHQLGATHTFNGRGGSCGLPGQFAPATAYEPGSGSTIMSYGGTCGTDDIVLPDPANPTGGLKDAMYSVASWLQMAPVVVGAALDCGSRVHTGNSHPGATPAVQGPYYIPTNTPFRLVGPNAAFPEPGEGVSTSIEQADLGIQLPLSIDSGNHEPLFRVFPPGPGERWFPDYDSVVNGTPSLGENLPRFSRSSVFKGVLRDNVAGGGGWGIGDIQVEFVEVPLGFSVLRPLGGATERRCGGNLMVVEWRVAGTNEAPISAETVDILMSTDNGQDFPWNLAADFPNAGAALVPIPFVPTSLARVKVQASGGLFYNVNLLPFEVATAPPTINAQPVGASICPGSPFTLSVTPSGGSPRHIQWYKDGNPLPGETESTYEVSLANNFHSGDYHVVVSNGCGEAVSQTVRVQVGVTFDELPVSQTPQPCDDVALRVAARGVGMISYQWLKGGEFLDDAGHIHGAHTPTLTLDGVRYEDEGIYWCAVSDECQLRTTNVVNITLPTPTWVHVTSTGPLWRHQLHTDMAFDPVRGVSVLYGGFGAKPNGTSDDLDDTWEWDGVEWTQRFPPHYPGKREQHQMVFDTVRNKILLFGGWSPSPVFGNSEVWEYDGSDWTLVTTSPGGPPTGSDYWKQGDAAFDSARGKMIVIYEDGYHPDPPTNKTWEFDSATATWANVYTGIGPSYFVSPIAYDASREICVGQYYNLGTNEAFSWVFSGGAWNSLDGDAPLRHYPAMTYDAVRRRVTLFGSGREIGSPSSWHSDTYALTGSGWTQILPEFHQMLPGGAFPPTAMVFDSRRRATVLIGNDYGEQTLPVPVQTWEYRYLDQVFFDRQPESIEAQIGETVMFEAFAAGAPELSYQWSHGGVPLADGAGPDGSMLSGTSTPMLTINSAAARNAGDYRVEVMNRCGSATSEVAGLTLRRPGDCNGDAAVDLADVEAFIPCLGGPVGAAPEGCACFDLNLDAVADLLDFARLQANFGG
ncbi:MAG: immunoglobulin domain-containing protein [Phycisphaerae bacterium]|nr:immunoglobulin domain-containing protein [Phycisphaerae bacterium]